MELPLSVIHNNICRGDILLSDFEGIDLKKFFVVMGISEDRLCGFFFINSNVHKSLYNKPEQLAMQYPLKKRDYDFLRYDSFLCASSVKEKSLSSIVEGISSNTISIIGRLKDEHIAEVLAMVNSSIVISKRHKRIYFS